MNDISSKLIRAKGLMESGRWEEARQTLMQLARKAPADQNVLVLTRFCLTRLGEFPQALYYAEKAASIFKDNADIQSNLAHSLLNVGRVDEAIDILRTLIAVNPGHMPTIRMLCSTLLNQQRLVECLRVVQEAYKRFPGDAFLASTGGTALLAMGHADEAVRDLKRAALDNPADPNVLLLLAAGHLYAVGAAPDDVLAAHKVHAGLIERMVAPIREPFTNDRDPDRQLRVGLVSGDFRTHASAYFFKGLFEHYDRSRMRLVLYHNSPTQDDMTRELRGLVKGGVTDDPDEIFRDISRISHEDSARLIRKDRIDILIDTSGLTGGNALAMFALKCAPIQATWLGYAHATLLRQMHYRISDARFDPLSSQQAGAEKLLHVEECFFSWQPPSGVADADPVPPGVRNGQGVTFGCMTSLQKYNENVVRAWCRIIRGTPGSRLMLKNGAFRQEEVREVTRRRFELHGMDISRLLIEPPSNDSQEVMRRYSEIDIVLDTWPYSGHTTTCEAAWMGVPTVTRAWDHSAGRVGQAFAQIFGLENLIAQDDEQYVQIAINLAKDRQRLAEIRASLPQTIKASVICDAIGHARRFEKALRGAWKEYCRL